jgi:hypothetical protein
MAKTGPAFARQDGSLQALANMAKTGPVLASGKKGPTETAETAQKPTPFFIHFWHLFWGFPLGGEEEEEIRVVEDCFSSSRMGLLGAVSWMTMSLTINAFTVVLECLNMVACSVITVHGACKLIAGSATRSISGRFAPYAVSLL